MTGLSLKSPWNFINKDGGHPRGGNYHLGSSKTMGFEPSLVKNNRKAQIAEVGGGSMEELVPNEERIRHLFQMAPSHPPHPF